MSLPDPRVSRLEREVADLKRQLGAHRGPGSSSQYGTDRNRTVQLGFAAQLTTIYDPENGYSWKRQLLDTTAASFVDPGIQPTGDQAFEVSGNKVLPVGLPVWMEPSPDGVGWVFQVGVYTGGGPAAPPCGGPGLLAGAMFCDCWVLTIVGQIGNMAGMPANSPLYLQWDGSGWTSTTQLTTCLGTGYVTLTRGADGDPKLIYTLSGGSGSGGGVYVFTFSCTDPRSQTLYFTGGNSGTFAMCCAPAAAGGPINNIFTLAVQWSAACASGVAAPCCPGASIPAQLCVSIVDTSGGHLAGWAGNYLLTYNGTSWFGSAVLPSGNTVGFTFGCSSPTGVFSLGIGVATRGQTPPGAGTFQQFAGSSPTVNCNGPVYLTGTSYSLPSNTETDGGHYTCTISVTAVSPSNACSQSAPPALCPDIASHPPLTITFGPHSGALTWTGSAWTGTVSGLTFTLSLFAGYVYQLTDGINTYAALSVSCGPFSATFGIIGSPPSYTVTGP